MSQIFAIRHPLTRSLPPDAAETEHARVGLKRMMGALEDCPCDAQQMWAHHGIALGCRQILLGEERSGAPPVCIDESAGLALAADARLFDRDALCHALGTEVSHPSGTLILKAYQRWGADCVEHLVGDYAFVVVDLRTQSMFCARDAVGVRPLYHATLTDGTFLAASDLIALRARLEPRTTGACELDEAFVLSYLADGQTWHPTATFDRRIKRLPPGHRMLVDERGVRTERWWHPEHIDVDRHITFEGAKENTQRGLETAIAEHFRGVEHVGVHLSGGLDSTLIAALASRQRQEADLSPPHAYTWCSEIEGTPRTLEERRLVESATRLGLKLEPSLLTAGDLHADLTRDVVDGIACETLLYETSHVLPAARRAGVRIILSGWGGDDLISSPGRDPVTQAFAERQWRVMLRRLVRLDRAARRQHLRFLAHLIRSRLFGVRKPSPGPQILAPPYRRAPRPYLHPPDFAFDLRNLTLKRLIRGRMSHRLESWAAAGARYGVVYGFPLLDRRLVEQTLRFDSTIFREDHEMRRLARSIADPLLPRCVVHEFSKNDDTRVAHLMPLLDEVVMQMLDDLSASRIAPERLRYVDLGALRALTSTTVGRMLSVPVLSFLTSQSTVSAAQHVTRP